MLLISDFEVINQEVDELAGEQRNKVEDQIAQSYT